MTARAIAPTLTALDGSIPGRIAQLRQMQAELCTRPVTGSLMALRKPLYKILRSAFSRQHSLNAATVDLIESLYREIERQRPPRAGMQAFPASPLAGAQQLGLPPAAHGMAGLKIFDAAEIATGQVVNSLGDVQDQAKLNNIRPLTGFNSVYTAPAELRMPERVALYSLVFGLQPRNALEIGTFRGGSTAIICGAMDDTGFGQLACIDPKPRVDPQLWSQMDHRCRLYEAMSPDILPTAMKESGGPFDFAWIDGDHPYECVRADIGGVLSVLADQAYILLHDAHSAGVIRAANEAVAQAPGLTDCGLISVEPTVLHDSGKPVSWAGMRLLRFQRS